MCCAGARASGVLGCPCSLKLTRAQLLAAAPWPPAFSSVPCASHAMAWLCMLQPKLTCRTVFEQTPGLSPEACVQACVRAGIRSPGSRGVHRPTQGVRAQPLRHRAALCEDRSPGARGRGVLLVAVHCQGMSPAALCSALRSGARARALLLQIPAAMSAGAALLCFCNARLEIQRPRALGPAHLLWPCRGAERAVTWTLQSWRVPPRLLERASCSSTA